jgi:hypothetical protein
MVAVEALVGRQVVRVRRLFYVLPEGTVRGDRGDLELTYSENGIVRLGVGADGEVLRVDEAPWQAPFELPLSATNAEFYAEAGSGFHST